jgi:DNA-binding LacI/PurR family transcriptional regulator
LDVARVAGVSSATVSRALSGNPTVQAQMRQRVLAVVEKLGYRPNAVAQGLRKGQGNVVALLVGDIRQGHFADLTKHVQTALEPVGIDLLLFNVGRNPDRMKQFLDRAVAMQLLGVIVAVSDTLSPAVVAELRKLTTAGTLVMSISQDLTLHGIGSIVQEERTCVSRSVRYLLERGRRRIAYIGRMRLSWLGSERYGGYRSAVRAAGVLDENLVLGYAYRYTGGYEAVIRAIDAGVVFDSLQTASDELAAGAMAALRDRGRRVPADVAVIGFGDIELSSYLRPSLTTWSSHADAIAEQLRLAFSSIRSNLRPALTQLERTLIYRDSA